MTKLTVIGWGQVRKMHRIFPAADVYFDIEDKDGNHLGAAVPFDGETREQFVGRVAAENDLPPGSKLIYSEVYG